MTNPGDAAFSRPELGERENGMAYCYCHGGLTKREYFAAAAMQGILADITGYQDGCYTKDGVQVTPSVTVMAVDLADVLIAELNKPK